MAEEKNLEGLGGWLIVVLIAIVASPLRIIIMLFPMYADIFQSGTWEAMTTPGTAFYSPYWAPLLIGEMFVNVLLVILWVIIAILFFTKRAAFPKWFIGIILFAVVFIILDAFAFKLVMPDEPVFDKDTTREFMRSLVFAFIWIPYMLFSRRVKETFVN